MAAPLGQVLTYFALVGLILTSAVATLGAIGQSISYQYQRLACEIAGSAESIPLPAEPPISELVWDLLPPAPSGRKTAVQDEASEDMDELQAQRLRSHLSRIEHLGESISKELAGIR